MNSLLPFLYLSPPCRGEALASQGTFEVLNQSLGDAAEVAIPHRYEVGRVWASGRILRPYTTVLRG